jgi:hypothetical protein
VLLDQTEERRLARPPRLVDPAGDLHAQPEAGGPSGRARLAQQPSPSSALGRRKKL